MRTSLILTTLLSCVLSYAATLGGTTTTDAQGRVVGVSLRSSWVDDSDLLELARLPQLTDLDLSETRITDIGFQFLKPLKNITRVNLYYAEQIGDGALAVMREWKNLKE